MNRIALIITCLFLLAGFAFAQTPTLDQHNHRVWEDSLAAIAGQTTDTSANIYTGSYATFDFLVFHDSIGTGASSSVTIYIDGAMESTGPWLVLDSMSLDSNLTTLRANTAYRWKDADGTMSDARYSRLRTTQHNGTNDSSVVVTRIKMGE
jgi:hypothetical protein